MLHARQHANNTPVPRRYTPPRNTPPGYTPPGAPACAQTFGVHTNLTMTSLNDTVNPVLQQFKASSALLPTLCVFGFRVIGYCIWLSAGMFI